MAWTEQFRHQVSEQVEKFGPTMRTMGSSVWSEPVLQAYNKGGGVSVEITVAKANGSTSEGFTEEVLRWLFPYTMEEQNQMSSGPLVQ